MALEQTKLYCMMHFRVNVWLFSSYQFYRGETESELRLRRRPFGKIRKEPSSTKAAAAAVVAAFAVTPTDRDEATLDKRDRWEERGGREGGGGRAYLYCATAELSPHPPARSAPDWRLFCRLAKERINAGEGEKGRNNGKEEEEERRVRRALLWLLFDVQPGISIERSIDCSLCSCGVWQITSDDATERGTGGVEGGRQVRTADGGA